MQTGPISYLGSLVLVLPPNPYSISYVHSLPTHFAVTFLPHCPFSFHVYFLFMPLPLPVSITYVHLRFCPSMSTLCPVSSLSFHSIHFQCISTVCSLSTHGASFVSKRYMQLRYIYITANNIYISSARAEFGRQCSPFLTASEVGCHHTLC